MRVLIAEHDHPTRAGLEGLLQGWGYDIVLAADGHDAWDALQPRDAPKLAVLDWAIPGLAPAEICRRVHESNPPAVYIVALTRRGDAPTLLAALEAGADDFVPLPFDGPELRTRLRLAERVVALQESLSDMQEVLQHEASHDPVTGALNHASVLDLLVREAVRTNREGGSLSVVLAHVDPLRAVNESRGRAAGDLLLRAVAGRLQDAVRPYDVVGRHGVAEFLVVLARCGTVDAATVAGRLRTLVAERPLGEGADALAATVSLGVCTGGAGVDPDQLLRAAAAALQRARAVGNCIVTGEPPEVMLAEEP